MNNQVRSPREAARDVYTSSMALFANVLAIVLTFFGTGPIYRHTVGFIYAFATAQYGSGLAEIATLLWAAIVAIGVFSLSRATVATAFTVGAVALAARFF